MKRIISILLVILLIGTFTSCGNTSVEESKDSTQGEEKVTIRLAGLKGPTSMGMVKLLDSAEQGTTENKYEFTMAAAADEITPKLIKGDLDIIAIPVNAGSILYNKTNGQVQMLSVNMLGAIYIAEKGGETIQSFKDLKGKTILATGKGTTPEYVLTYLLKQNGLDIETDVTMVWKSEPTETVAAMNTMDSAVAMLPEPFMTVATNQVEGLYVALNLYEEWNNIGEEGKFITAGLFVRKQFAEEHPEALKTFLKEYAASTDFVKANVEEAATLIEKYDIVKAAIAKKALPNCNIVCMTGNEMKETVNGYLDVLYKQNPTSVGEKLPEEDFYIIYE